MLGRISPPPLKRKRNTSQSTSDIDTSAATQQARLNQLMSGALRIYSWNVNGITPFIQRYGQKQIVEFFKPSIGPSSARKRRRIGDNDVTTDSDSDEHGQQPTINDEDPSKEGPASLRKVLRRFAWPHILFLQEVKIKPGDEKAVKAVKLAVNDTADTRYAQVIKSWSPARESHPGIDEEGTAVQKLADGGPEYEVRFNLPADPHNARGFGGRVYGVAAIIRKDFMTRHVKKIRGVDWDREGRVQVIETGDMCLSGESRQLNADKATSRSQLLADTEREGLKTATSSQPTAKLAIFNIYAVNGTSNPYHSTHTGAVVGTRHDRKLAFHTDLLQEATRLESEGFQVIIAGDLNVARSKIDGYPNLRTSPYQHVVNREDFNTKFFSGGEINCTPSVSSYRRGDSNQLHKVCRGFDGLDTFRHVHGNERKYSYYPRTRPWGSSCDRVDLILASRTLDRFLAAAGICDSPRDRGPSDHCPVWVEIGVDIT
jgi:exonuclease III